jgi:hypothetical protein
MPCTVKEENVGRKELEETLPAAVTKTEQPTMWRCQNSEHADKEKELHPTQAK